MWHQGGDIDRASGSRPSLYRSKVATEDRATEMTFIAHELELPKSRRRSDQVPAINAMRTIWPMAT